jgi:hypothetical protein
VKTALSFMAIGVLSALIGRNPDSYVMGVFSFVIGLSLLRVKGLQ